MSADIRKGSVCCKEQQKKECLLYRTSGKGVFAVQNMRKENVSGMEQQEKEYLLYRTGKGVFVV